MERHPIIEGLNASLPEPGAAWPKVQRQLWLNAAAACFDLIYRDEEPSAKVDPKIAQEPEAETRRTPEPKQPASRRRPQSKRTRQPSPTASQVEEMRALYEGGETVASVAKATGYAETSVRRALQRAGVEFRPRGAIVPGRASRERMREIATDLGMDEKQADAILDRDADDTPRY